MKAKKRVKPRCTWKCYKCGRFLHPDKVFDKNNYAEKPTYKSRGGHNPGKLPTTHRYTICKACQMKHIESQVEVEEMEMVA